MGGDDIFVNVVGGLRIAETSADVPVTIAAVSSFRDRPCMDSMIAFGEIGLAGEVRPVRFGTERIAEAAKQGFQNAIVPAANVPRRKIRGIDVTGVATVRDALDVAIS